MNASQEQAAHAQVKANLDAKRPWSCPMCPERFARLDDLSEHQGATQDPAEYAKAALDAADEPEMIYVDGDGPRGGTAADFERWMRFAD